MASRVLVLSALILSSSTFMYGMDVSAVPETLITARDYKVAAWVLLIGITTLGALVTSVHAGHAYNQRDLNYAIRAVLWGTATVTSICGMAYVLKGDFVRLE